MYEAILACSSYDSLSSSDSDDIDVSSLKPSIVSKDIEHVCTQRRVVMIESESSPVKKSGPIIVTFTLIAIREGKKLLGVRAVALNSELLHESGVFFLIDQMMWKENMKKFTEVQNSVKKLLLDIGFDYLFKHHLQLVPHKAGDYQLVLNDERMPPLEDQPDISQQDCTIT